MPLSRLTFAAYLIHPIVMTLNYYNRAQPTYISKWTFVSIEDHPACYTTQPVIPPSLLYHPACYTTQVLFEYPQYHFRCTMI